MKKSIFVFSFFSVFYGCSTAEVRVLPGESSNRVVVRDNERDDAEDAAAKAASDYCAKNGKELQYIGDATQYEGNTAGYMMTSNRDYEATREFKCR